jgi:hypothetical protein
LLSPRQKTVRIGMALLGGAVLASPAPGAHSVAPPPAPATPAPSAPPAVDETTCLASTLCSLKRQVDPRRRRWTPAQCHDLAEGVLASAKRHDVAPALLVAVMINESDLDEKAARVSQTSHGVAKDSGLMGIRCVLGRGGRCKNGLVAGMPWQQVMDPVTNVELGARYLAHYRGPKTTRPGRSRGKSCRHSDHAYWAHYNHGERYISRGYARHYPHNVAVLYYALARSLGWDASELLAAPLTVRDPGAQPRTADHPVGERFVKLCATIRATGAVCSPPPAVAAAGAPPAQHL